MNARTAKLLRKATRATQPGNRPTYQAAKREWRAMSQAQRHETRDLFTRLFGLGVR